MGSEPHGRREMVVYKDSTTVAQARAVRSRGRCSGNPLRAQLSTQNASTVCEWSPLTLNRGGYFAMVNFSPGASAVAVSPPSTCALLSTPAAIHRPFTGSGLPDSGAGYQRAQRAVSMRDHRKVREQVGGRLRSHRPAWTVNGMLWRTRLRLAAGLRATPVSSYAPATPAIAHCRVLWRNPRCYANTRSVTQTPQ